MHVLRNDICERMMNGRLLLQKPDLKASNGTLFNVRSVVTQVEYVRI